MIFINRDIVKVPSVLVEKGEAEKLNAIEFYSIPENHNKSFKFRVYAHKSVKLTLNELFNGKCAYCESRFLHVYVGDVEHFRPKGRVITRDIQRPGYYWLASEWSNLLISCRNCNQASREIVGIEEQLQSIGKVDKFPFDENYNTNFVLNHDNFDLSEDEENRLLINPCIEQPEDFFIYDYETGMIKPKIERNNDESEEEREKKIKMAKASIETYALQRISLVHEREKKAIEVLAQIQRVKEAMSNLNKIEDSEDSGLYIIADSILEREISHLMKFKDNKAQFIGLTNYLIDKFYREAIDS